MSTDVPVLIYDGNCGFCTSVAKKISNRWRIPAHARSWQDLGEDNLSALGITIKDAQAAAWWVDVEGHQFRGHLAVAKSLIAAKGWRGALGRSLLIPPVRWAAAVGYRLVARNRRHLPGSTGAFRT